MDGDKCAVAGDSVADGGKGRERESREERVWGLGGGELREHRWRVSWWVGRGK